MKAVLPPGTYTGRIVAITDHLMIGHKLHIALEEAFAQGTSITQIIVNDFSDLELRILKHKDVMIFDDVEKKVKNRHHKRKPQPNRGPLGRKEW